MATTDAQKKARDKWNAKFTEIKFRVTKEKRDEIKEYAANKGESVNAFLARIVEEAMEQGK